MLCEKTPIQTASQYRAKNDVYSYMLYINDRRLVVIKKYYYMYLYERHTNYNNHTSTLPITINKWHNLCTFGIYVKNLSKIKNVIRSPIFNGFSYYFITRSNIDEINSFTTIALTCFNVFYNNRKWP